MGDKKFTIICNRCKSMDCKIRPIVPPWYDDGYVIVCENCKQEDDGMENENEKPAILGS
jgi:hypothetical protein